MLLFLDTITKLLLIVAKYTFTYTYIKVLIVIVRVSPEITIRLMSPPTLYLI